jgi:hypothetical protein
VGIVPDRGLTAIAETAPLRVILVPQDEGQVDRVQRSLIGADVVSVAQRARLAIYVIVHTRVDALIDGRRCQADVLVAGAGIHEGWIALEVDRACGYGPVAAPARPAW